MAIKDVREYYGKLVVQKVELEKDFADFEEALKAGYITEDRLADVKDEYEKMDININRLAYILYLLELPQRKSKQPKFKKANKDIEDGFDELNASEKAVLDENNSSLKHIRELLAEIKKTGK